MDSRDFLLGTHRESIHLPKTTPFKMRVVKENKAISRILPVRSKDVLVGWK